MISMCQVDPDRLAPFREAMEPYALDQFPDINLEEDEWALSCISPFTIAYSCGAIGRPSDTLEHNHDPAERERCQTLAAAAAILMEGIEVGLGSAGTDYFLPFFITANQHSPILERFTEDVVRCLFGGTINPAAQIHIEPVAEATAWWQEVRATCGVDKSYEEGDEEFQAEADYYYGRWTALREWFQTQAGLHGCAFIKIGEPSWDRENNGTIWPRLVVGLTEAGSVVGICGVVVQR